MLTHTRKLQLTVRALEWAAVIAIGIMLAAITSRAQEPEAAKVCISQAAANICAQNARELPAQKEKVATLEASLLEKDKSIAELKETARKNEQDLRDALIKTQSELATKTGQLIGAEAMVTRLTAIIDFMLKNGRQKCNGLICVQF